MNEAPKEFAGSSGVCSDFDAVPIEPPLIIVGSSMGALSCKPVGPEDKLVDCFWLSKMPGLIGELYGDEVLSSGDRISLTGCTEPSPMTDICAELAFLDVFEDIKEADSPDLAMLGLLSPFREASEGVAVGVGGGDCLNTSESEILGSSPRGGRLMVSLEVRPLMKLVCLLPIGRGGKNSEMDILEPFFRVSSSDCVEDLCVAFDFSDVLDKILTCD